MKRTERVSSVRRRKEETRREKMREGERKRNDVHCTIPVPPDSFTQSEGSFQTLWRTKARERGVSDASPKSEKRESETNRSQRSQPHRHYRAHNRPTRMIVQYPNLQTRKKTVSSTLPSPSSSRARNASQNLKTHLPIPPPHRQPHPIRMPSNTSHSQPRIIPFLPSLCVVP